MPTLEAWQNALTYPRNVIVDSSQELADQVNNRPTSSSFEGDPKVATCLGLFSLPRMVEIIPADLLYSIGRITTPRIDNLADLCSTWARIRYLWAFNPDCESTELRLSDEAKTIDFHQKGLLSDEIGVGMADLIVQRFLAGRNPVDIDIALQNQNIVGMRRKYSTSPDYLFETSDGGFIVVECKGTQSGRSNALSQLKRGTEQVPSLEFPLETDVLTLVVGTCLSNTGTTIFVIDPPTNGDSGHGKGKKIIQDVTKFRKDYEDAQLSDFYLYLGVTEKAARYSPDEERKKTLMKSRLFHEPPQKFNFSDLGGDEYLGISQDVSFVGDQSRIRLFQVVHADLYQTIDRKGKEEFRKQGREYQDRISKSTRLISQPANQQETPNLTISNLIQNKLMVSVIGQDGTMLRLEINQEQ